MRYHNITKDDMLNGTGLRVVLWVSGCSHHCEGCHNPITWNSEDGLLFDAFAKTEIFDELSKDYIHGITFSGGDPLHEANLSDITDLAKEIKEMYPAKSIWLYTGANYEEVENHDIFQYVDVCVDGEFINSKMDPKLLWKGSSNQRVIDVKGSKEKKRVVLFCGDYEETTGTIEPVLQRNVDCCG